MIVLLFPNSTGTGLLPIYGRLGRCHLLRDLAKNYKKIVVIVAHDNRIENLADRSTLKMEPDKAKPKVEVIDQ